MKTTILSTLLIQVISTAAFAQVNDPLYTKQWALENNGQVILKNISELERIQVKGIPGIDINYVDTKDIETSKKELIVAVLDSGLDLTHPDLKDRIWYDHKLCDNIPNASVKACNGYNYLDNNNVLTDDIGHGTHVAGIIAANRNSMGVAGAADPRIKIMPVKVMNSQVNGFVYNGKVITDVIADAMTFAIKNGAEVINLSLGWPKLIDLAKVKAAFDLAEKNNVIVIAAAGNNNKDLPTFPCSYENVICVGAIDNRGELTDFTNYGSKVDIVAPGESIVSTYPANMESRVLRIKNYETKRGSSQAAPYVAAAVANLKLLHPGLSNDAVRSLLFRSSKKMGSEKNHRFVKFGMLDMKELLTLATKDEEVAFVNPQVKSLTEVKFNSAERKFSFNLDLKNLSNVNYKGLVCLSSASSAIQLDQNCVSVDSIAAHNSLSIPVSGLILDLGSDSHILVNIQIDHNVYQTSLVFSRDLNHDAELISNSLGQASFNDMAVINGDRRLSRMSRVFDKYKRLNYPEYFYLEAAKQTATGTIASLLTNEAGKFVVKTIALPKVNRILSIHRQDINQDGKLDYFIYTLSEKKDEIQFYLLDEKLNPLFKNQSKWSMTLTTFEGLPIDAGLEKFEWIKLKHPTLGSILVPSLYKTFTMPEADNSKIISERVIGAADHQFYLNPVVSGDKVTIDLRVVDSVTMMKALQKEMKIAGDYDARSVYLLKPFPQTEEESRNGVIKSLIVVDEDGVGKLFQANIGVGTKNYSNLSPLSTEKAVNQSLIYPIVNSETGAVTNEAIFTTLLDRSTAEFLTKDDKQIGSIIKLQEDWENPIISLIATFEEKNQKTYLVESRTSLTLLRENEEKLSLPIYRDSSFPGQSFAETLMPVLSQGRPGIYVNSTLIYGERLYSMIDTADKGFIRPLRLSIAIPQGCVPLSPEPLSDKTQYNYTFLCTDASKEVSLKFLPMSHL
ncbi:S8 family serine peptidase [Bacteriovorax sp. PP10]|uniref:S8 family serine peptidase n=1 Tax=Bacteriovorax antarcticus TaxID=3088717 RepID=A0ABU5VVG2_9BACT|nr:S8 family serine peptidase [Bacteriovorax sp. PP10]MEA9357034.1 S8 family serine peptidase [Bacteriovorax sp. PP10]